MGSVRGGRRCRLLRLRVFDQGLCHLGEGQRYLDRGHRHRGHDHRYLVYGHLGHQELMFIMVHGSWEL